MRAIDELMQEHRVIEQVLDALETAAARLAHGDPVPARFFLDVADFAAGFADGCHHRKEEDVLFPAMKRGGGAEGAGAIDVMLEEHEQGRAYVRQLREAARLLETGDSSATSRIVAAARGYAALLRDHIAKEDDMLFPMAAELIPDDAQREVLAAFERVEAGDSGSPSHEALLALAERLRHDVRLPQGA